MNFSGHVRDVALRMVRLLEQTNVPYALMGGLVVCVLSQGDVGDRRLPVLAGALAQGTVARLAGRRLGTVAGRGMHPDTAHAQGPAQHPAPLGALRFKVIGRSLQAMMHMQRTHLPGPAPGTRQQQGGGIGAAAEGHPQRQPGPEHRQGLRQRRTHVGGGHSLDQRAAATVSVKRP